MAPRLVIPVVANLDEFKKNMEEGASITANQARKIVSEFVKINDQVKSGSAATAAAVGNNYAKAAATTALKWTAAGVAILAVGTAIGAVVSAARKQLEEMVEIADKAAKTGVSPEFFQSFVAAAKGAEDQIKIFENALENAFKNTRRVLDTQASPVLPEKLKEGFTEAEIAATRAVQVLQTASAAAILSAKSLDERNRAVLVTIQDLIAAGQKLEAQNLGEKTFGKEFQNNLDTGKIKIDEIVKTIDQKLARAAGKPIFDNETVNQAKELDNQLKNAWHTIEDNLAPSWNQLGQLATQIKTIWVGIVELLAKASGLLPNVGRVPQVLGPISETIPPDTSGTVQSAAEAAAARVRRGVIRPEPIPGPSMEFANVPTFTPPARAGFTLDEIRRVIGKTPEEKPEKAAAEAKTAFDSQIESINKHIAALEADASAVGKTAEQHAILRTEMSLLQAIERDGGEVTNEQITAYAKLRATMGSAQALQQSGIKLSDEQAKSFEKVTARIGEAAARADSAKKAFEALNSAMQFGGTQLVNIFDALTDKTKDFGETMKSVLAAVKRAFLEAIIAGQGPLAGILGTKSPVAGGTGGLLGDLAGLFGGAKQGGGHVDPNHWYIVGERGKEAFIPDAPGTIVPLQGPSAGAPASVVPSGLRGMGGGAGGQWNVIVENHGAEVEDKGQQRNETGGFDFRIAVRSVMKEAHGSGFMDSSMGRYGVGPAGVGR